MPLDLRRIWSPLRWPTVALASAPQPVRSAWDACQRASQDAIEAGQRHRAAVTELGASDPDDRRAASRAVQSGSPMPASVRPARAEAAELLNRARQAFEDIALESERAVVRVAGEHRAEWMSALEADLDMSVDHAEAALIVIEDALTQLWHRSAVWRWLEAGRLGQQPTAILPDDARQALRAARASLHDGTPAGIRAAREARAAAEEAERAAAPPSFAGIVLDGPGKRALAG